MTDVEPYSSAAGVEAAIRDAARKAAAAGPSLSTIERIRLEYFNRFLSRVFSEGERSDWLLKGGTGMLARVPSTRSTLDIDLYRDGFTLDEALADLRRLAEINLSDHFRFTLSTYGDRPSSREKDLVDLVVLATTQDIDGMALGVAISTEARRRRLEPFEHLTTPDGWGPG